MPTDPELLPPAAEFPPATPLVSPEVNGTPAPAGDCCVIPNFGHTLLFLLMSFFSLVLTVVMLGGFMQRLSWVRHESLQQMQSDPRIAIPLEVAMYALAALLAYLIFPYIWRRPFFSAIHWNADAVRRRWKLLALTGLVLSIVIQWLSNYLPMPKSLPIDKFFQNPLGVWLIAIFGVTVAPAFEELVFRGFLLPSLANTWEYLARVRYRSLAPDPFPGPSEAGGDPPWSAPAIVFATVLTSIAFALLHADQLAHAWMPLLVLFCVSIVLCLVRLRTHSLAASAFVHSLYNATIFILLFVGTGGFRHLDKIGS
jgi:membrane protease YdiL (CAAX protease family)